MAVQRFVLLYEHDDSPVEVRAPVTDPERRNDGAEPARPREANEKRGVVFRRAHRCGSGVGEVVLAEAELTPQPPE